jgi:hypothetical protein
MYLSDVRAVVKGIGSMMARQNRLTESGMSSRVSGRMRKKFASATGRGAWSARYARKARHGQIGFPPRLAQLSCVAYSCCLRRADD